MHGETEINAICLFGCVPDIKIAVNITFNLNKNNEVYENY